MYRFSAYYQQLSQRLGNVTVRDLYDSDRQDERLRSLKRITVWLATFYFSYTLVDINLLPDITLRSVLLRGLIVGPPTIMLFAYYQWSVSIRHKELAGVCQACLGTLVWCVVLLGSNDPNVLNYFYAGLVFFLVLTIVINPPFEYSLYGSLFVFACLYTTIWFLEGASVGYVLHHLSVGMPVLVLSLMANYRFSAESLRLYLEKVSVEQLREELATRNAELERLSCIDPLTDLANRRALALHAKALQRNVSASRRVAIILIDVDNFKAYNDYYGHNQGDSCLCKVAEALRSACDTNDVVCRYGGEEFLVLHHNETSSFKSSLVLAESIRQQIIDLAIPHQPTDGILSVSVGVCCGSLDDSTNLQTLIKSADEALYQAKREGRNRVCHNVHSATCPPLASGEAMNIL